MQSARALLLVRALKPKQPLLAVKPAGISVERTIGGNYAMARHDNRNGITRDRSPHSTGRYNGCLVPRHPMAGGNTLGDLAIRSDLATRDRKQLVPDFTLKRRANQMQRRRIPRLLPCKISIQPSPRTLEHRGGRTICGIHQRYSTGTGNRVGAFNMFGVFPEKRGTKVLLPLKPKPRQTAAISGKQDFAQRRGKCRRDHQRLLSKLRNIIPRIVQTTPIDPKVTQGSRRKAPRPPPGPEPATTTRPHISPAAPTNNDPIAGRSQPSHRRRGPGLVSEHSADQCGALSAAPKEQDKAPHMVEDVLKTKPGPRRIGHTTRRAA